MLQKKSLGGLGQNYSTPKSRDNWQKIRFMQLSYVSKCTFFHFMHILSVNKCEHVLVHVHAHVNVHVPINVYVHLQVNVSVHVCIRVHFHVHANINPFVHLHN